MQVCPSNYENRKAYLIKFTLPGTKDDDHLGTTKNDLLEWGFQDDEITMVQTPIGLTELGQKERACLDTCSKRANEKTLVFLFYRGSECKNEIIGGVSPDT